MNPLEDGDASKPGPAWSRLPPTGHRAARRPSAVGDSSGGRCFVYSGNKISWDSVSENTSLPIISHRESQNTKIVFFVTLPSDQAPSTQLEVVAHIKTLECVSPSVLPSAVGEEPSSWRYRRGAKNNNRPLSCFCSLISGTMILVPSPNSWKREILSINY